MGVFVAMVAALSFSMAQAAQIDGLQTRSGPPLPSTIQGGLSVYVNPGDLGDALIGGYYNARGSLDMISLVNTSTDTGVVVKVRFREGKYSNEVLDFFVCLSAGDRWTAWVYGDDDTSNPAHLYVWDDDTPTCPDFGSDNDEAFHYSGTGAGECVTADMTKEGYFTVIAVSSWSDPNPGEMRVVATDEECCEVVGQVDADNFCVGANCTTSTCDIPCLFDAGNYLTGTVAIYDIVDGAAAYAYNMTAMADFSDVAIAGVGLGLDASPVFADCQDGLDGVNYVLTKETLIALYDIEDFWSAQSDVIITFPTKTQTLTAVGVQNPFQGAVDPGDDCSWDDACEPVKVTLWDDEENSPETTHGFSPSTTTDLKLCNEVNYITVGASAASLLDTDLLQFKIDTGTFELGWINFDFTQHHATTRAIGLPSAATPDATAHGLPAIGYELGCFIDGFYGHMLPLRYTSDITTPEQI